ncbi:MAG: doxG [Rhodospirillales bacterium]|jgi:2,3-dihydroxyethylbenzene 1,2-dioxygenase|nr:doxG [Rhodospirillales bacterium]MCE3257650.1 doxG [Nitrobacter vulgaris]
MTSVTELGYIGLGVSDLSKWKAFASEVLGVEVLETERSDSCYLRWDYWQYRVLLQQNGKDDIDFSGWRVAGPTELNVIAERLSKANIAFRMASQEEIVERQVLGLIKTVDPCGVGVEIFYGPRIEAGMPFYPGRRMHGPFVTGAGGLGHIVLDLPDVAKSEQFYLDILGMRGSLEYNKELPGGNRLVVTFASCNPRQHSFAFGNLRRPKRMVHVMTETQRLEDVGLTRDIVKRKGVKIALDIGQHHNDHAVSFYFETPSGWHWETGWGVVAPSGQAEWGTTDIWGHEMLDAGMRTLTPPKAAE